jgi:chemotaxis protein CheD
VAQLIVEIADCKLSAERSDELVTYALGSCVALAIHDPVAGVGGLLHVLLPDSRLQPEEAARNPFKFADTGIPELFHRAYRLGAAKERLHVYLLGGASLSDQQGVFAVGVKNVTAARKILWRAGVFVHGESTGGAVSRTVRLDVRTGDVYLRVPGAPEALLARTTRTGKPAEPGTAGPSTGNPSANGAGPAKTATGPTGEIVCVS